MSPDEVVRKLRENGLRVGERRLRLIEVLCAATEPMSVENLISASGAVEGLDASSVYRTLSSLEEFGLVRHSHVGERLALYSLVEPGAGDPLMVCQSCGSRQQVPIAQWSSIRRRLVAEYGFHADFAHYGVSGVCAQCFEALRAVSAGSVEAAAGERVPWHAHS